MQSSANCGEGGAGKAQGSMSLLCSHGGKRSTFREGGCECGPIIKFVPVKHAAER